MKRPDALYLGYEYSLIAYLWDFLSSFETLLQAEWKMIKIRRWQGGGDDNLLIRLLVMRQAVVSGVRAVKVTG